MSPPSYHGCCACRLSRAPPATRSRRRAAPPQHGATLEEAAATTVSAAAAGLLPLTRSSRASPPPPARRSPTPPWRGGAARARRRTPRAPARTRTCGGKKRDRVVKEWRHTAASFSAAAGFSSAAGGASRRLAGLARAAAGCGLGCSSIGGRGAPGEEVKGLPAQLAAVVEAPGDGGEVVEGERPVANVAAADDDVAALVWGRGRRGGGVSHRLRHDNCGKAGLVQQAGVSRRICFHRGSCAHES